jgi:pro-kumamolisin-like protein/IPT/TIG domain-containing protein
VNAGHERRTRTTVLVSILGAAALSAGALAPAAAAAAASAGSPDTAIAAPGKVVLSQPAPQVPATWKTLGPAPGGQVLDLQVALAGQDPSGLAATVAAVSTPGSPEYRHYLTAAQYAAAYGPSASEVAQVSSALRGEGLTVGTPQPGSNLLPVSGTASAVSAAFSTPLATVQGQNAARALVNTAAPQVPVSVAGAITGVVGLDGLLREHSMLAPASPRGGTAGASGAGSTGPTAPTAPTGPSDAAGGAVEQGHAATPQACGGAQQQAFGGRYTSTELASIFGLGQLFGQGRTGVGQTVAIVEFEQYLTSDVQAFESCYGLNNSIRNISIDGGPPAGPGSGEAALDVELASFGAPSASLLVYEAPNDNDAQSIDLFNQIASDDAAQVVTTSWGNCEQFIQSSDPSYLGLENGIFQRMAAQGQTMIAASGDAGSEDCFPTNSSSGLAVDDPGSQPDVVSAGGTSLAGPAASAQTVWNDCEGQTIRCAQSAAGTTDLGSGGGGLSVMWPKPSFQDAVNLSATRSVPDISYPSDPSAGSVVAFFDHNWTAFGGTSVAAPTNAGLFADTNQGCFNRLGLVTPALYAGGPGGANYTDITAGNNDFTDTNGGTYPAGAGYDEASGLGTPVDQNLAITLQGSDGCPSVAAVSPNTGPLSGSGDITIFGGGFANATSVTFGAAGTGHIVSQSENVITVIPPNAPGAMCVDVTVANPLGVSAKSAADHYGFDGDLACGQGYRFVASDGGVFDFGNAGFWGSTGSLHLNAPMVGMADTPSTNGYWLVASDGGIFTYGDARFFGSMGGQPLNRPIVGMAATPDGGGYWLVASDGGIFSFGDAQFHGSTGSMRLNKPVVGMASTSDGGGYWLVASDGGIFSFGDAQFHGSAGSLPLNAPVVGMAAASGTGGGYWLVASDGGIFDYGTAGFFGSAGSIRLNQPVVGMAAMADGGGYWLVAADGGIFSYGDAPFFGSTGSILLNKPIVGMSST